MKFIEQNIPGVWVIEPNAYTDNRGYFMESFKKAEFENNIGKIDFVQENESKSVYGVLRGMHAQSGDTAQSKLVRVIVGSVLDVIVDMRRDSPTFGQHLSVELTEQNKRQLFVPHGFYHGYLVLSPEAVFSYKVDNIYSQVTEIALNYADSTIGINWPIPAKDIILSQKDLVAPMFKDAVTF